MVEGPPKEDRMAKVKTNVIVRGLSGKLGGLVFQHMRDGNTYVRKEPDFSRRKFSEGQTTHQNRFKEAIAYANEAKTWPVYIEIAKGTGKSAYNFALSDWFKAPVIHSIERKDGRIRVEASDNVMVTKVQVTILDEEGKVVEKGDAVNVDGNWWEVVTSVASADGKVMAEACDLAGNVVKKEM